MATRRLGIIMHGVTGRMGTNQHLIRSILAIRADGGVRLADGDTIIPDLILVGRSADKLEALAKRHRVERLSLEPPSRPLEEHRRRCLRHAESLSLRHGQERHAAPLMSAVACEED